jgi:hypothetical protein
MARISMSIIKNEHGVFHVRKKVPKRLEEAAATVMGRSRNRVAWLQRSLKTKDVRDAKRLAPPILMEFDRILAEAEALTAERPLRTSLDRREIERIADFFYAELLAGDEESRLHGDSEAGFQIARQLDDAGIKYNTPYRIGPVPELASLIGKWTKTIKVSKSFYQHASRHSRQATSLVSHGRLTSC